MRTTLILLLILAAAAGGGCSYSVRIRNDNGQPLAVRLVQTDLLMKDWVLAETKVMPGETAELGPTSRVMKSHIFLEAGLTHGGGVAAARRAVLPGRHAFTITTDATETPPALSFTSASWSDLIP
ncbi:MAG: hypothetical protein WD749_06850 [Phycisphaerales bacterium]